MTAPRREEEKKKKAPTKKSFDDYVEVFDYASLSFGKGSAKKAATVSGGGSVVGSSPEDPQRGKKHPTLRALLQPKRMKLLKKVVKVAPSSKYLYFSCCFEFSWNFFKCLMHTGVEGCSGTPSPPLSGGDFSTSEVLGGEGDLGTGAGGPRNVEEPASPRPEKERVEASGPAGGGPEVIIEEGAGGAHEDIPIETPLARMKKGFPPPSHSCSIFRGGVPTKKSQPSGAGGKSRSSIWG